MKSIRNLALCLLSLALINNTLQAAETPTAKKEFYEIRVYFLKDNQQLQATEKFLKDAYLPALHRKGIKTIGVFTPVSNDTAAQKKIYVLIPHKSLEQFTKLQHQLEKDEAYATAGKDYLQAAHNQAPFARYETILLEAFENMPKMSMPQLKATRAERIYELRSYEGPTENLYRSKVEMFNQGGEIALFNRLGFNAVFYGDVLSGSRMPNLMYMTTFENKAARDEHWKTFGNDPEWKKLSALPQYQNTVSKSDIILLTPAAYSDF